MFSIPRRSEASSSGSSGGSVDASKVGDGASRPAQNTAEQFSLLCGSHRHLFRVFGLVSVAGCFPATDLASASLFVSPDEKTEIVKLL